MAHQLKYYKEIESHGHTWRVEFLQDTEDILTPMEIGQVLQSLRLVMQGEQADIDTPIVKTSMEMAFVDAPDLEEDRKCGYWEEFYTSSATEYKVRLLKDEQIEWTGYVTPDSFSEDLRYRGSVGIVARDNLGHLQDYNTDTLQISNQENRISLRRLLESAIVDLGIVGMDLQFDKENQSRKIASNEWGGNSSQLWSQLFDADSLDENNLYQAIEKVLSSVGATIRYVGKNTLYVSTIRNLGLGTVDIWADVPRKEATFRAYGRRELAPSVRQIEEKIEFSIDSDKAASYQYDNTNYIDESIVRQAIIFNGNLNDWIIPVNGYRERSLQRLISADNSNLLSIARCTIHPQYGQIVDGNWDDGKTIYYAASTVLATGRPFSISSRVYQGDTSIKISANVLHPVTFFDEYCTIIGNLPIGDTVDHNFSIHMRLSFTGLEDHSKWYYDPWTKSWKQEDFIFVYNPFPEGTALFQNSPFPFTYLQPWNFELGDIDVQGSGDVLFEIIKIVAPGFSTKRVQCYGAYFRLNNVKIEQTFKTRDEGKLTIRTKYKDTNSIMIERQPSYAPNTTARVSPQYYPNSIVTLDDIYYRTGAFWKWRPEDNPMPLGGLVHQQLLAFYAKPNNVLTGELVTKKGQIPDFQSLWLWNGKEHLLISGALNILTGRMESAVLREFTRYDHMWETWIEQDLYEVDYGIDRVITMNIHTNKALTKDDIKDIPQWITVNAVVENEPGLYGAVLNTMGNDTTAPRTAVLSIDGAYVRIVQRAAGDYGTDYGKDYS